MLIVIALGLIAIAAVVMVIVRMMLSINFRKQVTTLFAVSGKIPSKLFSYDQLKGLPEPVQHYLKHVLEDGQPYINYAGSQQISYLLII